MFASVGSHSNVDDPDTHPEEFHRADVLEFPPDGKFVKVYACRNSQLRGRGHQPDHRRAVVLHQRARRPRQQPRARLHHPHPGRRLLRLALVLHGGHQDPRHQGKHPELQAKVITPDVLVSPHFASLEMAFYDGQRSFPRSITATGSPPSMAHGIVPTAPATK